MKQIRIALLLILTLAISLTALTSCDLLEQFGISLPGENPDTPDTPTPDEKPAPSTCPHYVTTDKNKVEPTCSAEGRTADKVCVVCGTVVKAGKPVEKRPHSFSDGVCTVCGEEAPGAVIPEEWKQYETITIAEALAMCEEYVSAPSTERYYIIATVKSVDDTTYGKLMIEDETGEIMVYGTNSADGSLKYDQMGGDLKKGDLILIYGTLQNYRGTTKEIQNAWLIGSVAGAGSSTNPAITPDTEITIAEAIANAGLVGENDRFYITATVKSVTDARYGAMILVDENGDEISVYNSKNADGSVGYELMEDKPYKGDTVTVYATLHLFNGTPEISSAYITAFTHAQININPDDYALTTIADARALADETYVKVQGVVARITYASGFKPSGFYLVDSTDSIYVYDGDAAARVAVGNTVTVIGAKDHWILESEQSNAQKHGYAGCNQLTNVYLIANDEGNTAFDTSWIPETTVKELINTPFTTDITTTIFKVNALVKKSIGASFVNYYINDLDGTTGTYTYTQCSGGDFEWLDEFDGKICTVYLSVINAKSTSTGCVWRVIPIAVIDEGYTFDASKTPEFVYEYHVKDQFNGSYTADPALELISSVSSELLGFEGATVTYTSSDENVAKFTTQDGVTVFNLLAYGKVTVTVKVSYGEYSVTKELEIEYSEPAQYDYITVEDAINTAVGETVIVKGIVGPSLVNQLGFYLFNGEYLIAVKVQSEDVMADLALGNEVIITGMRDLKVDADKAATRHGQTLISDATVLVNNYGKHDYSTAAFVTDKTIEEIYDLDEMEDYTTTGFIVTVTVKVNQNNITLLGTDDSKQLRLYASGNTQYSWLLDYADQTVTLELVACNWNNKSYYTGCAIALILEDGTKIYNTLNFN